MPGLILSFHTNRYLPLDIFSSDLCITSKYPIYCTISIHDSCGIRNTFETLISNSPYIIPKNAYEKKIKNDYTVLEISAHIHKDSTEPPYEIQIYTTDDKN